MTTIPRPIGGTMRGQRQGMERTVAHGYILLTHDPQRPCSPTVHGYAR